MKFFVAVCSLAAAAAALRLPPNFKTCNRKQDDFQSCLLEAARFAVTQFDRPYKSLKMPSLNPLVIPRIEASVETPMINISSVLSDCKFSGFLKTRIDKFEFDFEKKKVELVAFWPELKSQCGYTINGHILGSPFKGNGDSSANFKNFPWTFNMTYKEVIRRNKTYVKPVSTFFDGKPESVSMNLEDLFQGDKELAERANKIINDNWSELYDDVKIYYLDNAKKTWLQIMNGWFKVSLEDAFDN